MCGGSTTVCFVSTTSPCLPAAWNTDSAARLELLGAVGDPEGPEAALRPRADTSHGDVDGSHANACGVFGRDPNLAGTIPSTSKRG